MPVRHRRELILFSGLSIPLAHPIAESVGIVTRHDWQIYDTTRQVVEIDHVLCLVISDRQIRIPTPVHIAKGHSTCEVGALVEENPPSEGDTGGGSHRVIEIYHNLLVFVRRGKVQVAIAVHIRPG